jgi:hypothetical protein
MSELAFAAVRYANQGIGVFPLRPRDKKPYGRTEGLKSATRDVETVRGWWSGRAALPLKADETDRRPVTAGPGANIGIATGAMAGFWVLDLDGEEAEAGLAALIAVHGPLPDTVEQSTGKGRHLCFAWNPAAPIRNSASKIGPKIDVRGEGGYIVAPPSIHPSGRQYAWTPGHAPGETPFAAAPDWLVTLALPAQAPVQAARAHQRVVIEGRATRYGEACLSTAARMIATAPAGQQQDRLWGYACFIGSLVGGREIERDYAREALIAAGEAMAPAGKPWLRKEIESHVERGLAKGEAHPRTAEARTFAPGGGRRAAGARPESPAQAAGATGEARALWGQAVRADCRAFRSWLAARGLAARQLPGAMAMLRAHQRAPIGQGRVGPAILAPMARRGWAQSEEIVPEALAVMPLFDGSESFRGFVGDPRGLAVMLTPWASPLELLVAVDLQDAWALGGAAAESGHDLALVVTPSLAAFAGGFLGDRWGRVNPDAPMPDPGAPPWLCDEAMAVWLAVRNDLRSPELRRRQIWGGTGREVLAGEAAARFYAALARQAWEAALDREATVRVMRPSDRAHAGFNGDRGRRAS